MTSTSQTAGPQGPDAIIELAHGYRAAKVLLSAVELGVFTVLAEAALDLDTLTAKVGISSRGARDFFDTLVALGLLQRDVSGHYRNADETGLYLDRGKSTYIGDELDYFNLRGYPHWHGLTDALRTGKPQSHASGSGYFSTLYSDPSSLELFAKGMKTGALQAGRALAAGFSWHHCRTMVDVGTAGGWLAIEIARMHPHIRGGGFDLPAMQPIFERHVRGQGLDDRLQFYAGDFLHDPLPCADVLVLGRILHNWDLPTKKSLLRKAYDALPTDGAIIVFERLIDDDRKHGIGGLLASLHMLIMTDGGFDFSAADGIGWMQEAGFRDVCASPLTSTHSMIAGRK